MTIYSFHSHAATQWKIGFLLYMNYMNIRMSYLGDVEEIVNKSFIEPIIDLPRWTKTARTDLIKLANSFWACSNLFFSFRNYNDAHALMDACHLLYQFAELCGDEHLSLQQKGAIRSYTKKACDQCRKRHSKCDGTLSCERCKIMGTECSYKYIKKYNVGSADIKS